jgi:LysR family nitrogen assimilation transcriptional regulator
MTTDGGPISLHRIAELPFVLPGKAKGRRALIERVFAEAKLKPNVVLEADTLVSEMWSVRNGVGCTILPVGDLSNFGPHAFAKPTLIEPPIYFYVLHCPFCRLSAHCRRRSSPRCALDVH